MVLLEGLLEGLLLANCISHRLQHCSKIPGRNNLMEKVAVLDHSLRGFKSPIVGRPEKTSPLFVQWEVHTGIEKPGMSTQR